MNYEKLIDTLKEYKENLIISQLYYEELRSNNLKDINTLEEIFKFDDAKTCFGDYDTDGILDEYFSLAIYMKSELIGGVMYTISHPRDLTRIFIVLCLKKEYRGSGIGSIIIKQSINSLFTEFGNIKSLYVTVLKSNKKCINLIEKNNFYKFNGYRDNDYLLVNGKNEVQYHYMYTIKDYKNDCEILKKYKKLNIK